MEENAIIKRQEAEMADKKYLGWKQDEGHSGQGSHMNVNRP